MPQVNESRAEEPFVEDEQPSVRELRLSAMWKDALLFTCAFTSGAVLYGLIRMLIAWFTDRTDTVWTIGLSQDLIFFGLIAGELFVLWNNGLRQGIRGHSIGKHAMGIAVVDQTSKKPTGAVRGVLRGLVVVVLIDLAAAALPIGLPTVLRRLTPDAWHLGFVTYLAVALLVIPVLVSLERRLADRIARTVVIETDSRTSQRRGLVVSGLEATGVVGLLGLAIVYIAFFSPLIRWPDFF